MAILKIMNFVAAGIYALLAAATFLTAGNSDAAGEGMAKGFALVLCGIAGVGVVLALIQHWSTQIIAAAILLLPVAFVARQKIDSFQYRRQLQARADGSAYFEGDPQQQLAAAIYRGSLASVEELLPAQKARINEIGPSGRTLLDIAVTQFMGTRSEANMLVIEYLLGQGADPNIHSEKNKPLLAQTDVIVEEPIFLALLEHGADPNTVDFDGQPVLLDLVSRYGEQSVELQALLESGADPNVRGSVEELPLAISARRMHWTNCRLLLEHGADPNLPEAAGFWEHYNQNAASYRKYNDAPPEFAELSQVPVVQAGRP